MDGKTLQTFLPLLILVVVVGLRLRSMSKEQPLKSQRMWLLPAILVVLGATSLAFNPPTTIGWAICVATFSLGVALGWQRGKMIRVWRDEKSGQLMQKASPAAMFLLLGIIAVRYVLRIYFGGNPSADGHMDERTLQITDALLTFAIGLIVATRVELALRARGLADGSQ